MKTKVTLLIAYCSIFILVKTFAQPLPCANPTWPNFGSGQGITNVTLNALNNTTPISEGFTVEYDSGAIVVDILACSQFMMTVTGGGGGLVSIDWNTNGAFDLPQERYYPIASGSIDTFVIDVPSSATLGNKIVRVMKGTGGAECGSFFIGGDVEDYKINITDQDMAVDSVLVNQVSTCYQPGELCNPILQIELYTSGSFNPVTITSFDLTTSGTTNNTDIDQSKIAYAPAFSPSSSCETPFGSIFSPSGAYSINGAKTLTPSGTCNSVHYFYLTYDISSSATNGRFLDATCTNVSYLQGGTPMSIVPSNPSPIGKGEIVNNVEICDNGIDDDCDGLVDCFDPDCSDFSFCSSSSSTFFYGLPLDTCTVVPIDSPKSIKIKKEWEFNIASNSHRFSVMGDLDNDGFSEVVVQSSNTMLSVLDGRDGTVKKTFNIPGSFFNVGAIADVDGNGSGEIYWKSGTSRMICIDYVTGVTLWNKVYSQPIGGEMSIVDFNGDGKSEILFGSSIYNAESGDYMGGFIPPSTGYFLGPSILAVDVLPDYVCADCSGLELVEGTDVYTVDINVLSADIKEYSSFKNDPILQSFPENYLRRYSSAADFDNDGLLDIATVQKGRAFIWNPRTLEILDSVSFASIPQIPDNDHSYFVAPTVDDLDGNGDLDIVFSVVSSPTDEAQNRILLALNGNLDFMWLRQGIADVNFSPPISFDLNDDGNKELIFRSEGFNVMNSRNLHILDAKTGISLDSMPCKNITFPHDGATMIADIDGDAEAEIVCGCEDSSNTFSFIAIGSNSDNWICSRTMWNQYRYHPAFVNDDLTIPRVQQNHGRIKQLNSWGIQSSFRDTLGNLACPLPDLEVKIDSFNYVSCDSINAFIEVCNNGLKPIQPAGKKVTKYISIYNGDPLLEGVLIKTDTLLSLLDSVGSCVKYNTGVYCADFPFELYVVVNDSGLEALNAPQLKFSECNLNNNINYVVIPKQVIAGIETMQSEACIGTSISLNATGDGTYQWSTGSNMNVISFVPTEDTTIQLIVTSDLGCQDTSYQKISTGRRELFIPNAISINGDGTNDKICIGENNSCVHSASLTVYDKFGKRIHFMEGRSPCWDDISNNSSVGAGVYMVHYEAILNDGSLLREIKNVSLLK